ncbi:MAG: glycosyltransferase [Planctomycetota bacterium]|jgi:glycosyltransferase involved in cell wall biosynthesis
MRLLYILHQFLPRHVTGTEQYVRSLARGMHERGHEVQLFAFEPLIQHAAPGKLWFERDEQVDGIPIRRVSIHPEMTPNQELADYGNELVVGLLRRYLDQHDVDLVHVFHLRHLGMGGILEPKRLHKPVVVNLMDFWFVCPRFTLLHRDGTLCKGPPEDGMGCIPCMDPELWSDLARHGVSDRLHSLGREAPLPAGMTATPVRRARALVGRSQRLFKVLAQADAVVAPSRFLRDFFEAQGFPQGVIRYSPYGVDPGRVKGASTEPPPREGRLEIGYVGSLTPHKGLHLLIQALRAIDGAGWHLHVHGDPHTHEAYTRQLRELAADDARITFHGGFPPTELGTVLSSLHLIVVPSVWYENTPFTVLEAQMMNVPVLASNLGGISEIVRDGENGLLFEVGNVEMLTKIIRKVCDRGDLLDGLRQSSPGVYTLARNLDDFESLYGELAMAGTRERP